MKEFFPYGPGGLSESELIDTFKEHMERTRTFAAMPYNPEDDLHKHIVHAGFAGLLTAGWPGKDHAFEVSPISMWWLRRTCSFDPQAATQPWTVASYKP